MVRIKVDETPNLYFLYHSGYVEIGLEFEKRYVVLFVEAHMPLKDAVKKYQEIAASFGMNIDEKEIIEKWIEA